MEQVKFMGAENGALQFSLSGDIDLGNADAFYAEVTEKYNAAPADVCFDCAELNFIDSTTLGTFVKILKNVKANGHSLRLVGLQSKIKKLFVICSLDQIIQLD